MREGIRLAWVSDCLCRFPAALHRRCQQPRPQHIPAAPNLRAPATPTAPRTQRARAAPVTARRTNPEKPRLPRYGGAVDLGSGSPGAAPCRTSHPGGGAFLPRFPVCVYLLTGHLVVELGGRGLLPPVEKDRSFPVASRAVLKSNSLRTCTPPFLFPSFENRRLCFQ